MTIPTERLRDLCDLYSNVRAKEGVGINVHQDMAAALTELLAAREQLASNAIVLDAINATLAEAGYDLPLQEQVGACIADVKALRKELESARAMAHAYFDNWKAALAATEGEIDGDGYKSLDHAMKILGECVAPYTGQQAQAVAKVLKQWRDKWAAAVDLIRPDSAPSSGNDKLRRLREWIRSGMRCPNGSQCHDITNEIDRLLAEPSEPAAADGLLRAAEAARQFIENGIALGYIRMPTGPDPAHETLPKLRAAIAKARQEQ
jgi:hypothetical protein